MPGEDTPAQGLSDRAASDPAKPDQTAIVAILRSSGLFSSLAESEAATCAATMRETRLRARQALFSRGDRGDALYLIVEGRIGLTVHSKDGRELAVRTVFAGEIIGEIAVLDGGVRTADAVAVVPSRVFGLAAPDLHRLIDDDRDLARAVTRFLCGRIRETTAQLETVALHPIEVRLARFLIVALQGAVAEPGKRVPLQLGLSQGELAQLIGASRPKVSVAYGRLEALGAVKRTPDRLFCDPGLLREIAAGADD